MVISENPEGVQNEIRRKRMWDNCMISYPPLFYAHHSKTRKYKIISDKYHFWFNYRKFVNVLNEYDDNEKNVSELMF